MRDIDPIGSYGAVVDADVDRTLEGLLKGNRYSSADLYRRYSDAAREAQRTPGHPIALGQHFSRLGMQRVSMTIGGPGPGRGHTGRGRQVSAWVIPWDLGN